LIAREVVPADDREEHDRARFAMNLKPQQDLAGFPAGQIQRQDRRRALELLADYVFAILA
jgi:hypothetical protein